MYFWRVLTPQLDKMQKSHIGFSLAEKLAIVQALDSVILADGTVHNGEINALSDLMNLIDFDSNFIVQARNLPLDQGLAVLKGMSQEKKKALANILKEMAIADGFIHDKETEVIVHIHKAAQIYPELWHLYFELILINGIYSRRKTGHY